jgi:hypothetical protein
VFGHLVDPVLNSGDSIVTHAAALETRAGRDTLESNIFDFFVVVKPHDMI